MIRLSSLGDVVLTLPLISALRKTYPDSRIDFLVRREYADALKGVPEITNIIELEVATGQAGLKTLRVQLSQNGYTHVLDLHNNFRSRRLRRLPHAKLSIINKRTIQRWLLIKYKINLLKNAPDIIGRYFEVASTLGVIDDGESPHLQHRSTPDPKLVAIAPGARHWNKRWPTESFVELSRELLDRGYRIELFGSAEEKLIAEEIVSTLQSDRVINLAGSLSISESIERLSHASLAITNDSGLMHVAEALGIETIAIFGPTVKEFGFIPRVMNAHMIENEGLYCRPCTAIGREDCPEGHFRCMRELRAERVIDAIGIVGKGM